MAQKLPFISCELRTDVDPLANKPAFLLGERSEQMEHERGRAMTEAREKKTGPTELNTGKG